MLTKLLVNPDQIRIDNNLSATCLWVVMTLLSTTHYNVFTT